MTSCVVNDCVWPFEALLQVGELARREGGQCKSEKVKVWWWVVEAVLKGCSTMMVRVVEP
jgi:hypothetical protein